MPRWLKTRQIKGNVQQNGGIVHQLLSLTDCRFGTTYFIWSCCKGQYLCLKQMGSLMGLPLKNTGKPQRRYHVCACVFVCARARARAWICVPGSNVTHTHTHANTIKLEYTIPFFLDRNKNLALRRKLFFCMRHNIGTIWVELEVEDNHQITYNSAF